MSHTDSFPSLRAWFPFWHQANHPKSLFVATITNAFEHFPNCNGAIFFNKKLHKNLTFHTSIYSFFGIDHIFSNKLE